MSLLFTHDGEMLTLQGILFLCTVAIMLTIVATGFFVVKAFKPKEKKK